MMTRRIELTPKACEDMEAIWRYGKGRFGEAQADNYIGKLSSHFDMLARHDVGIKRPELSKGIYSLACAHHVLFFFPDRHVHYCCSRITPFAGRDASPFPVRHKSPLARAFLWPVTPDKTPL